MSRQLELVVQGVLGTNPVISRTSSGRSYFHARLATTPTFRTEKGWQDGETVWFTAKAWGALAENLGCSLRKGDPVLLVGRFTQETWSSERGEMTTNVLTVSCGGHDLTRGATRFMRVASSAASASSPGETEAAGSSRPDVQVGATSPDGTEGSGGTEGTSSADDPWDTGAGSLLEGGTSDATDASDAALAGGAGGADAQEDVDDDLDYVLAQDETVPAC